MTQITQIFIDFFFLILSLLCLVIASFFSLSKKEKMALIFQNVGVLILGMFIVWLWITLQRPLFKTMGETRIWYSFFLSLLGGITYWCWRMNGLLFFSNLLAAVFAIITMCKPEMKSQELMPALQSVWFIPHVTIYMFAYAVIGCAFILVILEFMNHKGNKGCTKNTNLSVLCEKHRFLSSKENKIKCDLLVKIGTAALGIGLCFGALWAKKAWGQYWSWDIKETAALITWLIFLLYIHLQKHTKINRKFLWIIIIIGFLSLQFTWYGVKFLPVSNKSPHIFYSS
jgi:ABC-type transport system involved in cytochrome c biogenesis permease subunit